MSSAITNPCEWNPVTNDKARGDEEPHAEATLSVGSGKRNWHLCEACSRLDRFKRLRVRKPLPQPAPVAATANEVEP